MNAQQRQRWAQTRQRGPARFILFCMLAYGVPMGLILPAVGIGLDWLLDNNNQRAFSYSQLLSGTLPIALVCGLGFGVTIWRRAEREFLGVQTPSPWASPLRWAVWSGLLLGLAAMLVCIAVAQVLGLPYHGKGGRSVLAFAQLAVPVAGVVGAVAGFVFGRRRRLAIYSRDKSKIPPEVS